MQDEFENQIEHDDNVVPGRRQAPPLPYTNGDVQASRVREAIAANMPGHVSNAGLAPALESANPLRQMVNTRRSVDAELSRAHVALMEKEVIQPKDGDLFRLVRHYYRKLQDWHDEHTGWHIRRSSTVIRLLRYPSTIASGYVTEELKEPRDFACFTWILWYAESRQYSGRGNDQQFLLSNLAERIQEQSANITNSETKLDFLKQSDRYSMRRALKYIRLLPQ